MDTWTRLHLCMFSRERDSLLIDYKLHGTNFNDEESGDVIIPTCKQHLKNGESLQERIERSNDQHFLRIQNQITTISLNILDIYCL